MISRHLLSVLISLPILLVLRIVARTLPYTRQGFFCDDDEIRFPLREDTVDEDMMLFGAAIVNGIIFVLGEWSIIRRLTAKGRRLTVKSRNLHPALQMFLFLMISYFCSSVATNVSASVAKRTMSRLRPNFLAVCQPDLQKLCPLGSHQFVENYECLGKFVSDEYYSFPSGHSAYVANFAVFSILYLHRRFKFHEVIRGFAQLLIFLFAVFVCASRVRDYKHRLADVMGGAALGSLFALFFITHVLRNFDFHRYEVRDGDDDDESSVAEGGDAEAGLLSPVSFVVEGDVKSAATYGTL